MILKEIDKFFSRQVSNDSYCEEEIRIFRLDEELKKEPSEKPSKEPTTEEVFGLNNIDPDPNNIKPTNASLTNATQDSKKIARS